MVRRIKDTLTKMCNKSESSARRFNEKVPVKNRREEVRCVTGGIPEVVAPVRAGFAVILLENDTSGNHDSVARQPEVSQNGCPCSKRLRVLYNDRLICIFHSSFNGYNYLLILFPNTALQKP